MAYNPYGTYGYGMYPQYNANMGYQNFQQPTMQSPMAQQQMVQPQNQNNDIPFSEMHFGNLKEAEAYIVAPMKSVCFVNNALGEIYVKSADNMGNPSFKTYKQVGVENNPSNTQTLEIDPKELVRKSDLSDFATIKDLNNFANKQNVEEINSKLVGLENQLKEINKVIGLVKGDKNGR